MKKKVKNIKEKNKQKKEAANKEETAKKQEIITKPIQKPIPELPDVIKQQIKKEEYNAAEESQANLLKKKINPPQQGLFGPELRKAIESLLFSSGKAMSEKDLCELTGTTPKKVKDALTELKKDYDERDTSLTLIQNNDSWKLNVREKYITLVTKIVADTELPFPVLETLSVIAFKAPVMQAEVIRIRGTNAYEHIGVLIEGGFVEKRKKGRSFDLGLTPKCYDYFDVQGERGLKEVLKEAKKTAEKKTEEQAKLGNLQVVDVVPPLPDDKKKLGELEVVDTLEQRQEKIRLTIDSNKPDNDFLTKIEDQIDLLSKRNDEHDEDELFKKPEATEGEGQPDGETEGLSLGAAKTAEIFGSEKKKVTSEDAYPDEEESDKDDKGSEETQEKTDEENEEEDEEDDYVPAQKKKTNS